MLCSEQGLNREPGSSIYPPPHIKNAGNRILVCWPTNRMSPQQALFGASGIHAAVSAPPKGRRPDPSCARAQFDPRRGRRPPGRSPQRNVLFLLSAGSTLGG
jgi:hypothetical protein